MFCKLQLTALTRITAGFFGCVLCTQLMIIFDQSTIILAVIGMVGLLSTFAVLVSSFKRNRCDNGKYQ